MPFKLKAIAYVAQMLQQGQVIHTLPVACNSDTMEVMSIALLS